MSDAPAIPSAWFASDAPPLEVDFGCHRGTFLLGMAEKYPDRNFLGIEKQTARVEKCLKKIRALGLANVHAVPGTGAEALAALLPEESVSVFHVSFPDPWPKRRHATRRLMGTRFLEEIARVLRQGGILRVMTDDAAYFSEMKALLRPHWEELDWQEECERPVTAFEKTFVALGLPVHRCAMRPVSRR
jgi:tRNA (guanine-N7-)-methyltransferase